MATEPRRFVLRNATIADGTGGPLVDADVLVDDGVIMAVGPALVVGDVGPDVAVFDLTGRVLAPGFIDIHTHYDAQWTWDPDFTPSSWHGVTTLVMGNCGFGIAPTPAAGRTMIARTLEIVEGMSYRVLASAMRWEFESYPEFLDMLDAAELRCNVVSMLGHTPLRLTVMGDAAYERAASPDELAQLAQLAREAMDTGAAGFSSSLGGAHFGYGGRPVPSRFADPTEFDTLLRCAAGRVVQMQNGPGFEAEDLVAKSKEYGFHASWGALMTGVYPRGECMELLDRLDAIGAPAWAQIGCRPIAMAISLREPYVWAGLQCMRPVMAVEPEDRAPLYARLLDDEDALAEIDAAWPTMKPDTTVYASEQYPEYAGRSLRDLADELGTRPARVLLETALAGDLDPRFRVVLSNGDEDELADLIVDPRTVLGLSDAGAHADQMCDAGFATDLLGRWVRDKGVLDLPTAVWRLTGQPAEVFGLDDRGRVAPGFVADLVAFDPATVAAVTPERVLDLPAGEDRMISRSRGIEHVWVGGVCTRADGENRPGVRPGRLLRAGR